MAVGQNLLFGRMKQKIGGIVTSTWKGINVIKSKPLTVANPKTDLQLMRRSALIQAVAIGRKISAAIQLGFKEQAVFKSAFNAFVGYILRNAFNYSAPPAAIINYSSILVSQGTITKTVATDMKALSGSDEVLYDWNAAPLQPGQSNSDKAVIVAYNETKNWFVAGETSAVRSDGTVLVSTSVYPMDAGDIVHMYLFFYNTASRKASDSDYQSVVAG